MSPALFSAVHLALAVSRAALEDHLVTWRSTNHPISFVIHKKMGRSLIGQVIITLILPSSQRLVVYRASFHGSARAHTITLKAPTSKHNSVIEKTSNKQHSYVISFPV